MIGEVCLARRLHEVLAIPNCSTCRLRQDRSRVAGSTLWLFRCELKLVVFITYLSMCVCKL